MMAPHPSRFTQTQLSILTGIANSMTLKEIAEKRRCSVNNVSDHLRKAWALMRFQKGRNKIVLTVRWCAANGLIMAMLFCFAGFSQTNLLPPAQSVGLKPPYTGTYHLSLTVDPYPSAVGYAWYVSTSPPSPLILVMTNATNSVVISNLPATRSEIRVGAILPNGALSYLSRAAPWTVQTNWMLVSTDLMAWAVEDRREIIDGMQPWRFSRICESNWVASSALKPDR